MSETDLRKKQSVDSQLKYHRRSNIHHQNHCWNYILEAAVVTAELNFKFHGIFAFVKNVTSPMPVPMFSKRTNTAVDMRH